MDNDTTTTLIVVAAVAALLLLVVLGLMAARRRRTAQLREGFGPEYDRAVDESGDRRAAERELAERRQEHEQLTLRPLSAAARERYLAAWTQAQARFVETPRSR